MDTSVKLLISNMAYHHQNIKQKSYDWWHGWWCLWFHFFLSTLMFPTGLCQLDLSLCHEHSLSLPTFLRTEGLDQWGRKQGSLLEDKLRKREGEWREYIYLKSFCSLSSICIRWWPVYASLWNGSGGKPYLRGGTRQPPSALWLYGVTPLRHHITPSQLNTNAWF